MSIDSATMESLRFAEQESKWSAKIKRRVKDDDNKKARNCSRAFLMIMLRLLIHRWLTRRYSRFLDKDSNILV